MFLHILEPAHAIVMFNINVISKCRLRSACAYAWFLKSIPILPTQGYSTHKVSGQVLSWYLYWYLYLLV